MGVTFSITKHYPLGVIRKVVANQTDTLTSEIGLRKLPFPDTGYSVTMQVDSTDAAPNHGPCDPRWLGRTDSDSKV